jgi:cell division protein FtsA
MNQTATPRKTSKIVAALDVGSSKTGCLIVELGPVQGSASCLENARVLGVGYQRSQGIKGGLVLDPRAVEHSIRGAVDKAERQAGLSVDQLYISMNTGRIQSQNYGATLELGGAKVKNSHIEILLRKGWDHIADSTDAILHALPIGFALDGVAGIENPVGFSGQNLFADFHVVSADLDHVRRLMDCIEDSYLSPMFVVAAPFASALATIRRREANEGVAVLDLGGGTSSLAVFAGGRFIFAHSLAKGGMQISAALARNFSMSWLDAERLKLHIGANADHHVAYPKGTELISRHLMGIFLHQKKQMEDSGFAFNAARYVVLTGGGALYYDAARIAAEVFGKPVRIGVPRAVPGLPPQLVNPAFSALWGVIAYQNTRHQELAGRFAEPFGKSEKGSIARFGSWLHHLTV